MTGVVLCGGKSSRMGSDKGLLQQQSLPWAEITANILFDLKLPVVLSVSSQQYPLYKVKFEHLSLIKDEDSLKVHGPLKGIFSVHLQLQAEDLLVLACDMPAMQKEVIGHLIKTSSGKEEEAFVFKNETNAEPLCAIYTSKGLKRIYELYEQGQLKKHSLHYVLDNIVTAYLSIPAEWKEYFSNYNSPEDLKSL